MVGGLDDGAVEGVSVSELEGGRVENVGDLVGKELGRSVV